MPPIQRNLPTSVNAHKELEKSVGIWTVCGLKVWGWKRGEKNDCIFEKVIMSEELTSLK